MEIDYHAFKSFWIVNPVPKSNCSLFPLQHTTKSLESKILFPRQLANSNVAIATVYLYISSLTFLNAPIMFNLRMFHVSRYTCFHQLQGTRHVFKVRSGEPLKIAH